MSLGRPQVYNIGTIDLALSVSADPLLPATLRACLVDREMERIYGEGSSCYSKFNSKMILSYRSFHFPIHQARPDGDV